MISLEDYRAAARRGLTQSEAARELGVTPSRVNQVAKAHKIPFKGRRRGNGPQRPVHEVSHFSVQLDSGDLAQVRAIAERDGCSVAEVIRVYVAWGLEAELGE